MDLVRPLKFESPARGGTETDLYPTELDPLEDYLAAMGISFRGLSTTVLDLSSFGEIQWKDAVQTGYKTLNSLSTGLAATRYVAICGTNSNASNGKWLEFFASVSSSDSPFVVPNTSTLKELSLSVSGTHTGTVEIFRNGSSISSISLSSQDKNSVSGLSIGLAAGDEISAQVTSGNMTKPVLGIFIQTT
jgi:hypothetical protein